MVVLRQRSESWGLVCFDIEIELGFHSQLHTEVKGVMSSSAELQNHLQISSDWTSLASVAALP